MRKMLACLFLFLLDAVIAVPQELNTVLLNITDAKRMVTSICRLQDLSQEGRDSILRVGVVIPKIVNTLVYTYYKEVGEISPEKGGAITKQLRCQDGSLLFDDGSLDSLISSLDKIGDVLGNMQSILSEELTLQARYALIITLEGFAEATPGELTIFNDEEQALLIEKAISVYENVM